MRFNRLPLEKEMITFNDGNTAFIEKAVLEVGDKVLVKDENKVGVVVFIDNDAKDVDPANYDEALGLYRITYAVDSGDNLPFNFRIEELEKI